ncbi:AAA family ATPase [Chitinophaga polysaccharea]|uniref:AAA family ATPase n=1 Tax=Chitinophaga polysaccharea TaxID=1293035 RepID=UPI00115A7431|nr:AAA family ATPase [Chitinophaga polysaccharea]
MNKENQNQIISSQSEQIPGLSTDCPIKQNEKIDLESNSENQDDSLIMELLNKEVMKGSELAAFSGMSVPYLWEGLIPQYGISFLTGASDCNKSTFLRQFALSIANGDEDFLDIPLNIRYQKVILVITEDLAVNVAALMNKQLQIFPDKAILDNITFVFPASNIIKRLDELLSKGKVDCVIVDTWTDTFTGDSNASNSVRAPLHPYNELVKKYGCSILALHHEKKGSEDKDPSKDNMLGSMGIQAYARVVLQMKRDNGNSKKRLLTAVKGNYIQDCFKDQSLVLEVDEQTLILTNTTDISIPGIQKSTRI